MNTNQTTTEQQRAIAQAAADFTPPEPQRYTLLMPHRESIATLRRKGASYRAIAKILGTVEVHVSLDTLSKFYREAIEEKPARRNRRQPFNPPAAEHLTESSSEKEPTPSSPDTAARKDTEANGHGCGKGPRIADPSSI